MLKAMFNTARDKWEWKGFENPCTGIKLAKPKPRFVVLTSEHRERIVQALAECDNPEFWPFVELSLETTQRKGSLLSLVWEHVDLEGRVMNVETKTGPATVPLSNRAVSVLQGLPGPWKGKVFRSTSNAIDCAWDGARAGRPHRRRSVVHRRVQRGAQRHTARCAAGRPAAAGRTRVGTGRRAAPRCRR